jgi:dihydrofolate reductase
VRSVYIDGGVVVCELLREQLVDEMTVTIVPILLGAGIPLFAGSGAERPLALESSASFPSGLVQVRYKPATG